MIGISCDFVLHIGHAYTIASGNVNAVERSRYALIHMGPSILAAAFTTICSAIIMLFTIVTFFQKFATILFFTVVIATIGSNVVFLTLIICFGPSEPTKFIDTNIKRIKSQFGGDKESNDTDDKVDNTKVDQTAVNL